MKLKFDSVDTFSVPMGTFLSARGIDLGSDVTEIVLMVKNEREDADASAVRTLTLGAGITKVISENAIIFNFEHTDFGVIPSVLQSGNNYHLGIGFKTATLTKFLEADLADSTLQIMPDFIHD